VLLRAAAATDADAVTAVFLASRTAALPWLPQVHGCRVIASGDGSDNEEREPDVTYEWLP
jgi:hypothetical protein